MSTPTPRNFSGGSRQHAGRPTLPDALSCRVEHVDLTGDRVRQPGTHVATASPASASASRCRIVLIRDQGAVPAWARRRAAGLGASARRRRQSAARRLGVAGEPGHAFGMHVDSMADVTPGPAMACSRHSAAGHRPDSSIETIKKCHQRLGLSKAIHEVANLAVFDA